MSAAEITSLIALALLQASLVVVPRPDALASLARLRAPAWAMVLPGAIIVGTAAPLSDPSLATALVALAAIATPVLAVVAILWVARGRRALVGAAVLGLLLGSLVAHGLPRQVFLTVVTALGALSVGVGLTRLIPPRWLIVGMASMAVVDVLLLAIGVGETAAGSMATAGTRLPWPPMDTAAVGPMTIDFPDLVLAAVLGGALAGTPVQRRAAATLAALAVGLFMLLLFVPMVPATVPVALTVVRLEARQAWRAVSAAARSLRAGRARERAGPPLPADGRPAWCRCAACTS